MENSFNYKFLLDGKTAYVWQEYMKNQRNWFQIAVIRVLNWLFYNLNNSFH